MSALTNKERHVGRGYDRVDGRLKVTGQAKYANDFSDSRLVHAFLVLSPIAKGQITSVRSGAARRAPGVLHVVTHENAPRLYRRPDELRQGSESPVGRHFRLLQSPMVQFSRQPIGIVIADTRERAEHAASLLTFEFREAAAVVTYLDRLAEARPPQDEGRRASAPRGDAATGLANAPVTIDATYISPMNHHNPLGPHATVAEWTDDGRLTVYNATQGVYSDRAHLAWVFDVPEERVTVHCPFTGGGFGTGLRTWPYTVAAALAARVADRPVKLVLSREQMYVATGCRPPTYHRLQLGAEAEGQLVALTNDAVHPTSRYEEFTESEVANSEDLYRCPNLRTSYRLLPIDFYTPAYMRGPGEITDTHALECSMDELAYALALDPLELRLRNYAEQSPREGKPYSSKSLRQCYARGAERFGWSRRDPNPRARTDGDWWIGSGMATAFYPTYRAPASARVTLYPDGTAVLRTAATDIGVGTYTIMTQVVADALELPYERVSVELGTTDNPRTGNQGGSMMTTSLTAAVVQACSRLKDKLGGQTLDDLGLEELSASYDWTPGAEGEKYAMAAFGAHFVEVAVHRNLGTIRVRRVVSAMTGGRILNQKTARSQLLGGLMMGMGFGLFEETLIDERYGRILNADLGEYVIPVQADVPEVDLFFVEEVDPITNPLGTKGIGEIAIIGISAAINNAIYHACGVRVRDLPVTLDKLLLAPEFFAS